MIDKQSPLYVHVKRLNSWLGRFDRWQRIVAGQEPWDVRKMPSKNSKHHTYDSGARLAAHLGLERPRTVDDLRQVLATAKR